MIIFTDVDGTLYDYDRNLSPNTVYAIKKMRENGHKVFMVTGRSKAENKQEIWDIGFDGMIGGNGSYVEVDGKVLLHQTITLEQSKHFVDWFKSRNIEFYEESNNGLFASENFEEIGTQVLKKYALGKGATQQEIDNTTASESLYGLVYGHELVRDDINKVSFILNTYNDYLDAIKEFPDMVVGTWGGKGDDALFGDLGVKDVDKGKAIKILLDYIHEDIKNTYAIGDAKPDIPMLQLCNVGITFSSGGKEVQEIADYITDDVGNDGFYKAFKHFNLI